jgi:uncharacterized repeat protein (TIGR01451 family)
MLFLFMFNHHNKFSRKTTHLEKRSKQYIDVVAKLIALVGLATISDLLVLSPLLAAPTSPGITIDNQVTGTFTDGDDLTLGQQSTVSNIVSITVAEVAGITITSVNIPTPTTGASVNFDFKIQNFGNDPTKFFLPTAPSSITGGTTGSLSITSYISASGVQVDLATPIVIATATNTGGLTDPTLGGNTTVGSIPPNAAIIVRVPVLVTAAAGSSVSVTLGNTTGSPTNSNTPYIANTNDVYTVDNADGAIISEAGGIPINGDTTGHRQEASATRTVNIVVLSFGSISGTVFDDANGDGIINNSDIGTDTLTNGASINLYAVLTDNSNTVLQVVPVTDGTGNYNFDNVLFGTDVKVLLSIAQPPLGTTFSTSTLTSGWVSTLPILSFQSFNTGNTNVANKNFGIEQLPNSNNLNSASQNNPGGNMTVQVPILAGTDPEDGILGIGKSFKIVTLPTNGILYYPNISNIPTAVLAGQTITNYDPSQLKIDPDNGAITVTFTYAAIDAAGKEGSTAATVSMPFTNNSPVDKPNLLLVKRVTAINGLLMKKDGSSLNTYQDDLVYPYDDNKNAVPTATFPRKATDKWPGTVLGDSSTFLLGAINGGLIKPQDEVDYTIYFLSAGDADAINVSICDLVPDNQTFVSNAYGYSSNSLERGITLFTNNQITPLTNADDSDAGRYFPPSDPNTPTICKKFDSSGMATSIGSAANNRGAIVVNLGIITKPDLVTGSPFSGYGYIRFRARVD